MGESLDVNGKLSLSVMFLDPLFKSLSIVASSGVDFYSALSLELGAGLLQPLSVQFLEILSCGIW